MESEALWIDAVGSFPAAVNPHSGRSASGTPKDENGRERRQTVGVAAGTRRIQAAASVEKTISRAMATGVQYHPGAERMSRQRPIA